jgi:hypothetical protein
MTFAIPAILGHTIKSANAIDTNIILYTLISFLKLFIHGFCIFYFHHLTLLFSRALGSAKHLGKRSEPKPPHLGERMHEIQQATERNYG